ncbi:unnamed protein product, partial [marine sediment metagenome]
NSKMIGIRHEDISLEPTRWFKKLYAQLGIKFSPKMETKIKEFTNDTNPTDPTNNEAHVLRRNSKENIKRWKKVLSYHEIEKIREITENLAKRYYLDEDW